MPPVPLRTYLLLGLLLRLPAVFLAHGFGFLDQQYQAIDPAWHLASGQAWLPTWEWNGGLRSLAYPGALAGMLRLGLWCGLDTPQALMVLVRLQHALLSLLPLLFGWLLLVRWRPVAEARPALWLLAASGLLVHAGTQPAGVTAAANLAVAGVLAACGPRRWPALGGLLLGLACCCRFQDACFVPGLLAVAMWQRRWAAAGWFLSGLLPPVLAQGWLDLHLHGRFLHSVRANLFENLALGAADKWQAEPWWFYAVLVAGVLLLLPPFVGVAWRSLRAGAALAPEPWCAAAGHLLAHSAIGRKGWRFELASAVLLLAVLAIGWTQVPAREALARWHRRLVVLLQLLVLLWASLWYGNRGPVAAATALAARPDFDGGIAVVDGNETSLGGAFYLQRLRLEVQSVPRPGVAAWLAAAAGAPRYVLAVGGPLDPALVAPAGPLEPIGSYTGMFDLRSAERRWLYRRRD